MPVHQADLKQYETEVDQTPMLGIQYEDLVSRDEGLVGLSECKRD